MKFFGLFSISVLSSVVVFESSGCNMFLFGWLKIYIMIRRLCFEIY